MAVQSRSRGFVDHRYQKVRYRNAIIQPKVKFGAVYRQIGS